MPRKNSGKSDKNLSRARSCDPLLQDQCIILGFVMYFGFGGFWGEWGEKNPFAASGYLFINCG